MPNKPKPVLRWECSDGREFRSETSADEWEKRLENVERANEALKRGENLLEVLKIAGHLMPPAALEGMTGETRLSIPHWQCHEDPAYRVVRVNGDLSLCVHGRPARATNDYGADLSAHSVARHLEQTLALAAREHEEAGYEFDIDDQRP